MSDLRQRLQEELAVRGRVAATQQGYCRSIDSLAAYYNPYRQNIQTCRFLTISIRLMASRAAPYLATHPSQ